MNWTMNVGQLDRAARMVGGLALMALAYTQYIGPWGYIGVLPLATGLAGFCPLYGMLGIRTCSTTPS
jgi:hypothetical protein